jgi:hypothetical protein
MMMTMVSEVKEEEDGVVTLGWGQTCIYIKDGKYGIGQVKNEGEGVRR